MSPKSYIDYDRLYHYRFKDVDQHGRQLVWNEIALHVYRLMRQPSCVLDPAAGRCEFINAIPAVERWAVDAVDQSAYRDPNVKAIIADVLDAKLPFDHFDGVFVSNFLEHLATQDQVARVLDALRSSMCDGGRIAILGPNFKYCAREYFDCADHTLALTHIAVAEHLYAAGFDVTTVVPRFLPFSFRGLFPASPALTRVYLHMPAAWSVLGKQFLLIAAK